MRESSLAFFETIADLGKTITGEQQQQQQWNQMSSTIRRLSKKVIFATSKGKQSEADELVKNVRAELSTFFDSVESFSLLKQHEPVQSSLEEYMEAIYFYDIVFSPTAKQTSDFEQQVFPAMKSERIVGALSDVCGELARHSVRLAIETNPERIENLFNIVQAMVEALSGIPITDSSYLRTKYDQAERALRKIEDILFQLKIR